MYTYEARLPALGARRFWLLRFTRLWPAHVLTFVLVVLLLPDSDWTSPVGGQIAITVANLALLHAWIPLPAVYFSYNVVSWSISTEFAFYLLFPWLARDWRSSWAWKVGGAALLTGGLIVLSNALSLSARPDDPGVTAVGLLYPSPIARLFEFTVGMLLATVYPRVDATLARRPRAATALEFVVIGLLAFDLMSNRDWLAGMDRVPWIGPAGVWWLAHGGAALPAVASVVLVAGCGRGLLSRVLAQPVGVLLGEISYSVYLLHSVLFRFYGVRLGAHDPFAPGLSYGLAWVVLLLLSYALWRWVETPVRHAAKARWKTVPPAVAADRRSLASSVRYAPDG
jgi:peptidoglycan/LPS O-acetylase OafA/YrhL